MSLGLKLLQIHIPLFFKKKALRDLFSLTAQAFGSDPPGTRRLSYRALLESYALFTRSEAQRHFGEGRDAEAVRLRLFAGASELGDRLRRRFLLRRPDEVLLMSKILYRVLGIEFEGRAGGEVKISSCFFSRFYNPESCRLVSALDEGLAAGLSGGGRLEFYERITEGKACCRARFSLARDK